jgi:hypothetical protein
VSSRIKNVRDLEVYKLALEFSIACNYINKVTFKELDDKYEHILAMLNNMEMKADSFCFPSTHLRKFSASGKDI